MPASMNSLGLLPGIHLDASTCALAGCPTGSLGHSSKCSHHQVICLLVQLSRREVILAAGMHIRLATDEYLVASTLQQSHCQMICPISPGHCVIGSCLLCGGANGHTLVFETESVPHSVLTIS